jgi:hypothetical protein
MSIISHISVGTSKDKMGDMLTLYDAFMPVLGAKRQMMIDTNQGQGRKEKEGDLAKEASTGTDSTNTTGSGCLWEILARGLGDVTRRYY